METNIPCISQNIFHNRILYFGSSWSLPESVDQSPIYMKLLIFKKCIAIHTPKSQGLTKVKGLYQNRPLCISPCSHLTHSSFFTCEDSWVQWSHSINRLFRNPNHVIYDAVIVIKTTGSLGATNTHKYNMVQVRQKSIPLILTANDSKSSDNKSSY